MSKAARFSQGLLLALLAVGAHAAEPTFTPGFYLGTSVGGATHDVDNGGAQDSILIGFGGIGEGGIVTVFRSGLETDDDSTGWRGLAGYRFNRYFAVELEYLDFGTSHIHESYLIDVGFPFPDGFTIDKDFDTDVSGPALSALGKLPLGEKFELFLRAGVLFADSKVRSGPPMLQIPPGPGYGHLLGPGADRRHRRRLEFRRALERPAGVPAFEEHRAEPGHRRKPRRAHLARRAGATLIKSLAARRSSLRR